MSKIEIETADGVCPSYVYRPTTPGPWPAVLVFMDGVGIRPAMLEVGERIAKHGYFVLLPDLFYRAGPYEPMDPKKVFGDPAQLKILREKFFAAAQTPLIMNDTKTFLDWIAAQPDVKPGPIGTTGYCMGGRLSVVAAAKYPNRIAATAAYHPGGLATDAADSPHTLAPEIKSRVYVAGAIEDPSFTDEAKARFEEALTKAGVEHEVVTFPAKHGWVFSDTPVYDAAQSERHYETLFALLDRTLKSG